MRRIEELKEVKYDEEFKELYELIYSSDLDYIIDFSEKHKENIYLNKMQPLSLAIISVKLNKMISIDKLGNRYRLMPGDYKPRKNKNYTYEKSERYCYKSLPLLLNKLKEIIRECL